MGLVWEDQGIVDCGCGSVLCRCDETIELDGIDEIAELTEIEATVVAFVNEVAKDPLGILN
jgi:hypothetical protein